MSENEIKDLKNEIIKKANNEEFLKDRTLHFDPVKLLKYLKEKIEISATITGEDLNNDLSGYISKENNNEYKIIVNNKHSRVRRNFTTAHELAHLILHKEQLDKDIKYRKEERVLSIRNYDWDEIEANQLAAELLVPNDLFARADKIIQEKQILPVFAPVLILADMFDVSVPMMSIKLGIPYE